MANPNLLSAIKTVINKHNLKPIATLVTHGHLDHTFSVRPFANEYRVPTLIHTADRKLLANPFRALTPGGESQQIMASLLSHNQMPLAPHLHRNDSISQNLIVSA
jgi:glyoxylase-like metal-dependent hydrolase (beta-lactamase superfamily II)